MDPAELQEIHEDLLTIDSYNVKAAEETSCVKQKEIYGSQVSTKRDFLSYEKVTTTGGRKCQGNKSCVSICANQQDSTSHSIDI